MFNYLVSLQSEHKVKEYRSLSNRLQMENDQLKSKLEQCHREYHFQVKFVKYSLRNVGVGMISPKSLVIIRFIIFN